MRDQDVPHRQSIGLENIAQKQGWLTPAWFVFNRDCALCNNTKWNKLLNLDCVGLILLVCIATRSLMAKVKAIAAYYVKSVFEYSLLLLAICNTQV